MASRSEGGLCGGGFTFCLDLQPPVLPLGSVVASQDGVARVAFTLPQGLPTLPLRFQAAVVRGQTILTSNAATRVVLPR